MDELSRRLDAKLLEALCPAAMTSTSSELATSSTLTAEAFEQSMRGLAAMPVAPPPVKIVASPYMTEIVEDFSVARSPSRTRRRMRYNASRVTKVIPRREAIALPTGDVVVHPTMLADLKRAIDIEKPPYGESPLASSYRMASELRQASRDAMDQIIGIKFPWGL